MLKSLDPKKSLNRDLFGLAPGLFLRLLGFLSFHLLEGFGHFLLITTGIELHFFAFAHGIHSQLNLNPGLERVKTAFKRLRHQSAMRLFPYKWDRLADHNVPM